MGKPNYRRKKKPAVKASMEKSFFSLALLVAIVLTVAVAAHFIFKKPTATTPVKKQATKKAAPVKKKPAVAPTPLAKEIHKKPSHKKPAVIKKTPLVKKVPQYEIYPKDDRPSETPPVIKPLPPKTLPSVAIIIDDMGYDQNLADSFLSLDTILTFSLFPHSPHGTDIARQANAKGLEVMLHLPMEPNEYPAANPGPGALLTSMAPDELINVLKGNLDNVPFISGVNNHMGSKMTASHAQMNQIFTILKQRRLFFIDSRTTTKTLTRHSASLFKVPWAERNVFLDHFVDEDFIRKQFKLLIVTARRQGEAVGIGHPHKLTYQILSEMLPVLKQTVKLVPASAVVHIAG
jgi:uncharacterized protein